MKHDVSVLQVNWSGLWVSWFWRDVREFATLPFIVLGILVPVGAASGAPAWIGTQFDAEATDMLLQRLHQQVTSCFQGNATQATSRTAPWTTWGCMCSCAADPAEATALLLRRCPGTADHSSVRLAHQRPVQRVVLQPQQDRAQPGHSRGALHPRHCVPERGELLLLLLLPV